MTVLCSPRPRVTSQVTQIVLVALLTKGGLSTPGLGTVVLAAASSGTSQGGPKLPGQV
jgi:hypothetical protein